MKKMWFRKSCKWAFSALFISAIFWSCRDDEIVLPKYDPSLPVKVNSFVPDSGGVGTQLVVIGENFGSDTSLIKVFVNDNEAKVIGVNDTRVYAVVPVRAGTGNVRVEMQKQKTVSSEKQFKYKLQQNVLTVAGITDSDGNSDRVDGNLESAQFNFPYYMDIDDDDNIFLLERNAYKSGSTSHALRYVSLSERSVSTKLTSGGATGNLRPIAYSITQDTLWCTNDTWNAGVDLFTLTRQQGWFDPTERLHARTGNCVAVNPVDGSVVSSHYLKSKVNWLNTATGEEKELLTLGENYVVYLAFSKDGEYLYMTIPEGYQAEKGKFYRAKWDYATKTLNDPEMLISLGYLKQPRQVACDYEGNVYICDAGNHTIEIWNPKTREIKTFAGIRGEKGYQDGLPLESKFYHPTGICVAKDGAIYVADNFNHRIRKIVVE
ncbi:hypothetical protein EMN47_11085 [Prolixibacteraceae bacterium JC049]|nr:hypothetical protein [Prolixibacteraceae bacterium JC049]